MPKIFKGCDVTDSLELNNVELLPTVTRTSTYYPLPHYEFYTNAAKVLKDIGVGIVSNSFGLTPKRDRMFMWLETDAQVNGLPLCIGGRNSYDKSMSAGLCVGTKILVCSNKVLASYENGGVVSRKHTSAENIDELSREFNELLSTHASTKPDSFFDRFDGVRCMNISDRSVKETLVDLTLSNVIAPTDIRLIWEEFIAPKHPEFLDMGRAYQFLMAATEVFKLHKGADYQIKAYDGVAKALGL
tara:strand:- start:1273 stop:2004 length:732 start_codon:yes stop_codon:yes gene_type:complete